MSTQEIADRLVELCRTGQYDLAYDELFDAKNVVNIEPAHTGQPAVTGVAAIKKKGEQFNGSIQEMHSAYVSDPIVAGNQISLAMGIDYTNKAGERVKMDEICVYEVKNGKIVKEQFFF